MNILKTNPIAIGIIQNEKSWNEALKKAFGYHEAHYDQTKPPDEDSVMINANIFKFNPHAGRKIVRVSKQVMDNARLINFDSIKANLDNPEFFFDSLIIILDSDISGYIKVERLDKDICFFYCRNLSPYYSFDNDWFSYNSFSFFTKEFQVPEIDHDLFVVQLLTYLSYGDITSRFIPSKASMKIGQYGKFLNNSKTNITFIDSLWRERISTEGFKVRGHFRLQPIGEGRQSKKLIWIEQFEKHGYNRKATIELT